MLELISDTLAEEFKTLAVPSNQRMVWQNWNSQHVASGEYLTPIKVKNVVRDKIKRFIFRSVELSAVLTL